MFTDKLKLFTAAFVVLPAVRRNMKWNVHIIVSLKRYVLKKKNTAQSILVTTRTCEQMSQYKKLRLQVMHI